MIKIGLDTHCVSYLIDSWLYGDEPKDSLANERIALTRLFFYVPDTLRTTQTVVDECIKIKSPERAELHKSSIDTLFSQDQINFSEKVFHRSKYLEKFHSGINDCKVLAENEDVGNTHLITCDKNLIKNLSSIANLLILKPTDAWQLLAPCKEARPNKLPEKSHPLSSRMWWRW